LSQYYQGLPATKGMGLKQVTAQRAGWPATDHYKSYK
jgi:hypothetical protein